MNGNVVIVGSGLMGAGIAACAAVGGRTTILTDAVSGAAAHGLRKAWEALDELCENALLTPDETQASKRRITVSEDLDAALADAGIVIEAIVENVDVKRALFASLDAKLPPNIPILSNTSGLRITDIAADMQHPARAVTAHFWFPAHLVPLVEVVVGERTDLALAEAVRDELTEWHKSPVLVKRDLPGQLANRILQAVIREAVNIVEIGLASPEDVDTAIKMGMGIRLPVWGPLEHIDAVGIALCQSVQQTVLPEISASQTVSPIFAELLAAGKQGYKSGEGFYDWNTKDMTQLASKRNRFIMLARRFMEEEIVVKAVMLSDTTYKEKENEK